jgi:hypothetical protein
MPHKLNRNEILIAVRDVLLEQAIGADNRLKADELATRAGVPPSRQNVEVREAVRQLRLLDHPIASRAGKDGGFFVATTPEDLDDTVRQLLGRIEETQPIIDKLMTTSSQWKDASSGN